MFCVLAGVPEGMWSKDLLNLNVTAYFVASATFKPITRSNAALKAMNTQHACITPSRFAPLFRIDPLNSHFIHDRNGIQKHTTVRMRKALQIKMGSERSDVDGRGREGCPLKKTKQKSPLCNSSCVGLINFCPTSLLTQEMQFSKIGCPSCSRPSLVMFFLDGSIKSLLT